MTILLLFLIGIPMLGSLLVWLADTIREGSSKYIGVGSILTVTILAMIINIQSVTGRIDTTSFEIIHWILGRSATLGFYLSTDSLGLFMALIATVLGLLIALFSFEYMDDDEHLSRYWFYLQLFISGMVLLVLAADLIAMYIGWEMVGLCSFGLISHWHTRPGVEGEKVAKAGIKAFVFTRIGDIGFLVAIVMIYSAIGSVKFDIIMESTALLSSSYVKIIAWGILLAAFGKSAQFPFIPWLSSPESIDIDAMQGPTTVSALIHAATMVKAGVYLISRSYLLFELWTYPAFTWTLIIVAGITALITAISAITSDDIKRILAYSTISQLAYMFLAMGLAYTGKASGDSHYADLGFYAAQGHLLSHALFKSLLFLTAGYVIHKYGSRKITDLRGILSIKDEPVGLIGFVIGGLALIGLPPLNGFFSKELIISTAFEMLLDGLQPPLTLFVYLVSFTTALLTAIYVTRLLFYLYFPVEETVDGHDHDYPIMTAVILLLSGLTLIGGILVVGLPLHFGDIISVNYHFPQGMGLLNLFIILLLIGITMYLTVRYLRQIEHTDRSRGKIQQSLIMTAEQGFYIDHGWSYGWKWVKQLISFVSKSHSGNLNHMVMMATLVAGTVLVILIGGSL